MQVGGRRSLARARTGAGVGPAGGTFWDENVHFHKVSKVVNRQPLVYDFLLVLQANLVIRVPVLKVIRRITVNRLICWSEALYFVCSHALCAAYGRMG